MLGTGAGSDWRWNSNTFGIPSRQELIAVKQDTDFFPAIHDNFLIKNIGRTEVEAELKYGTKVMWYGVADACTVKPGQTKILDNWERPYYVTALQVSNHTNQRAIVHCATSSDKYYAQAAREPGAFDETKNWLLEQIYPQGVKYTSYMESGLSGLLSAFFTKNGKNVFEQIKNSVQALGGIVLQENILEKIQGIIDKEIAEYQERIAELAEKIKDGERSEKLATYYVNLARDLIGFENKFRFGMETYDYQNVNMYILPFYSCAVLLKVSFYIIGIQNHEQLGLGEEYLENIKYYINRTVSGDTGANKYIEDLYKNRIDHAYDTVLAEDLYDNMMNVRTYIGTQGLEYVNIWNNMIESPANAGNDYYNNVITYSVCFGRQTPNLIKEAIPTELSQPLTPELMKEKLNKIERIEIHIWDANSISSRIGGMQIVFENGDNYTMGTLTKQVERIEWHGATLNKLEVYGGGSVDFLIFYFSDGRIITAGSTSSKEHLVFELKNHHIVSIFVSSDSPALNGQAANISVSYRLNDKN